MWGWLAWGETTGAGLRVTIRVETGALSLATLGLKTPRTAQVVTLNGQTLPFRAGTAGEVQRLEFHGDGVRLEHGSTLEVTLGV